MDQIHSITLVLLLITVAVSYKGFKDPVFFDRYKFILQAIKNGERIRFWSSGFLHVDWQHLVFNMFTLVVFANSVIYTLGGLYFVLIYFGSLFAGNWWTYRYRYQEKNYSAVGASGAVTGVVYASIILYPDMKLMLLFLPIPLPAYIFGMLYLFYAVYGMKNQWGNIGHAAHLGGAIAGLLITILLVPSLIWEAWKILSLLGVPILLMFIKPPKKI